MVDSLTGERIALNREHVRHFRFKRRLQIVRVLPQGEESSTLGRLWQTFGFMQNPRAPPSGANPSALVGEKIEDEDDVLHIRYLPDFGGTLGMITVFFCFLG